MSLRNGNCSILRVWVQVMMRSGTSEKNVRRLNESFMEFHNGDVARSKAEMWKMFCNMDCSSLNSVKLHFVCIDDKV